MAYADYGYTLNGSQSVPNPNPFVYPGSGITYGYDAPFNPQLDHLAAAETRVAPEWSLTTTSTTSLTTPWPVGSHTLPVVNWPPTASQSPTPAHHSSLILPPSSINNTLHLHHESNSLSQSGLLQNALPPSTVQQLQHGCSTVHNSPMHITLPHSFSNSIPASLHPTPITIGVAKPISSNQIPERRLGKAKIKPATSPLLPFDCNICGKFFSQAANLTAHRRVHTGEKPFSCSVCNRTFSQSSSLVTHKRIHNGERPYSCGQCDKSFTDSSTLTKHQRTHSGDKPYRCTMCSMRFSQSGNLHRHMKTHING